jgi:hypothetical protein
MVKLLNAIAGNGTRKHRRRWKVPKQVKFGTDLDEV